MEEVKAKFEEIKKLCKESVEEYGENSFYFKDGASESEIISWEKQTGIMIPETYREWLKLTKECMIRDNVASFFFPEIEQASFLPEGYVLIGNVVGDGEVVCFDKNNAKFLSYFEGKINENYDDFIDVLNEIIVSISGNRSLSAKSLENLKKLLENNSTEVSKESAALFMQFMKNAEEREKEGK